MGKDGLGDSGYPPSRRKVADEHAVHALVRLANASPGELTLITIGPLTNVRRSFSERRDCASDRL